VCRELTKTYEEVRRGTLAELADWAEAGVRGEITVVLDGAVAGEPDIDALVARVEEVVAGGVRLKDACAQFAAKTGASRRELYEAVLASRER
jgi:16S rRNA (cytidine1402-2'-O)-methyltransferase